MMRFLHRLWYGTLKRPYKLAKTVDSGSGTTVLLIHGLATSGNTWTPLVKLADKTKWHLLGFDLLGFGKSPVPNHKDYDVRDHADSVLASLDRKTKAGKIIIVGHSMGCLIASHIAWLHPEMVAQLVLYEPPLFADSPEFRSHSQRRKFYFAFYEELLRRPRILLSYSKLVARFLEGRTLSVDKHTWFSFERSLKNTIMSQTAYDELKAINVPTNIIYGKFDFVVTRRDVKQMLQANKNIEFHLVNEMHDVTTRSSRYIIKLLKPL